MKLIIGNETLWVGFLNEISFLVGYFKKICAFLVYSICFHETVHDKCGRLDKSAGQNENVLERGFVKLCLKSVNIKWPALRLDPETVYSSDGKSSKTTNKQLSSGLLKVKQVAK